VCRWIWTSGARVGNCQGCCCFWAWNVSVTVKWSYRVVFRNNDSD
jgi:hypothetical protein